MQAILEILVRVAEILTIVAGSVGVCLSLVLLVSPGLIRQANRALNRQFLTEGQMAPYNPSVSSELFALRHHLVCGGILVGVSIFILLFLFLEAQVPASFGMFADMAIEFAILLGKTAGVVGLLAGTLLFFSPATFQALGQRVNLWIDTGPVFNRLDTVSVDVDSVFLKYHLVCGLVGLVVSAALIIISMVNFLGTSDSLGRLLL